MPLINTNTLVQNIPLFSAAAPVWSRRMSNIITGSPILAIPAGASTLLAVNHPGLMNSARVFRFTLDGTTTVFTLPTAAAGVTYPTTNAAGLTVGNYLEAIAMTFAPQYQGNATVFRRVGSDASPTAGQFRINGVTVTLGAAGVAGQVLEVIVVDPTTIASLFGGTPASPTAGATTVGQQVIARTFMTAGVAQITAVSFKP